jgi:hypothetical protein
MRSIDEPEKTLAGTNTLAYFAQLSATKKKYFIKWRLGENCERWPANEKNVYKIYVDYLKNTFCKFN